MIQIIRSEVLDNNALLACQACSELVNFRSTVVPGEWSFGADDNDELKPLILLLGRNPGREEDSSGRPFVGRAGKVLREIVEPMHDVANFYFANMVKCWTPKDRDPSDVEIENCAPWVQQELKNLDVKGVVLFGRTVERVMGKVEERSVYRSIEGVVWVSTYHPSFAARGNLEAKLQIGRDISTVIRLARI